MFNPANFMKILNVAKTASLGGLIRIFVLLAGFFYSSFSFAIVNATTVCPGSNEGTTLCYVPSSFGAGKQGCFDSGVPNIYLCGYQVLDASLYPEFCQSSSTYNCLNEDSLRQCSDGSYAVGSQQCPEDCSGNTPFFNLVERLCSRGDCPIGQHTTESGCVDDSVPYQCSDGSLVYGVGGSNGSVMDCSDAVTCQDGTIVSGASNCSTHCYFDNSWDGNQCVSLVGQCDTTTQIYQNHSCYTCPLPSHPSCNNYYCILEGQIDSSCPPVSGGDTGTTGGDTGSTGDTGTTSGDTGSTGDTGTTGGDTGTGSTTGGTGYNSCGALGTVCTTNNTGGVSSSSGSSYGSGALPSDPTNIPQGTAPIPCGDTCTASENGYNDGVIDAKNNACGGAPCSASFCSLNPQHDDCSGFNGFEYKTFGVNNITGDCPIFSFNFPVLNYDAVIDFHCQLMEQTKSIVKTVSYFIASFIFLSIILSA